MTMKKSEAARNIWSQTTSVEKQAQPAESFHYLCSQGMGQNGFGKSRTFCVAFDCFLLWLPWLLGVNISGLCNLLATVLTRLLWCVLCVVFASVCLFVSMYVKLCIWYKDSYIVFIEVNFSEILSWAHFKSCSHLMCSRFGAFKIRWDFRDTGLPLFHAGIISACYEGDSIQ